MVFQHFLLGSHYFTVMVRDDLKLPDDGGRDTQISRKRLAVRILVAEISSLPDIKLARWSTTSCALALACWPYGHDSRLMCEVALKVETPYHDNDLIFDPYNITTK
jgi:hypothetical protein